MKPKTGRILRYYLRQELHTWPEGVPTDEWMDPVAVGPTAEKGNRLGLLLERVRAIGELFVGMANGPFLLVMRASDPLEFIKYADEHPTHAVYLKLQAPPNVRLESAKANTQVIVRPTALPDAYLLSFGLPRVLQNQILFDEKRGVRLAPALKQKFFSEITVYRRAGDRDVLYRLTYEPQRQKALPSADESKL